MMRKPYKYFLLLALLSLVVGLGMTGAQAHSSLAQTASRPNIIFVFTDDQDPGSLSVMPNVQNLLVGKGKTFPNATFTQPLCCPSRASMLRGQYPHNTKILGNGGAAGGEGKFRSLGLDRSTYATWLSAAGYKTGYFGKYMNNYEDETYVPPGWARWVAADHEPATMRISDNGKLVYLGDRYETFDLAMRTYSLNFLKNNVGSKRPFFMAVSFTSPHHEAGTATPMYEQRYADRFSTARWPRTPNFNEEDRSDKPLWVRNFPAVTQEKENEIDQRYGTRLRSLLTVDDTVGTYVSALVRAGELSNTYIFYFTDNSWHMGDHALPIGKNTPYTEDVEFPLMVRGPGIAPNTNDDRLVSNIDVAPTFAEIANTSPTSSVDGRSILPLLRGQEVSWRTALLVEGQGCVACGEAPTYKTVRTNSFAYHYYPGTEEEELYDLIADPYQLQSRHDDPAYAEMKATLRSRLEMLKTCAGVTCRAADSAG
jgi:arylsulfatase A-like enzyme